MTPLSGKTKENIINIYKNRGFKVYFDDEKKLVTISGNKEYVFSYDVFILY